MLLKRLAIVLTAALLISLVHSQLRAFESPVVARAQALLGERWYLLSLAGEPLGYWYTNSFRDQRGRWVFESTQRSALNPDDPVTISTRRVFAAAAPHALIDASYRKVHRMGEEGTHITHGISGYSGQLEQDAAGTAGTPVALNWHYALADYLDFEVWLHADQPTAGSVRAIRTLDFARMEVQPRQLKVVEHNATGYQIENSAPHAATTIQLDHDYVPQSMLLAGLFDLDLTSRDKALAPGNALHSASYYVPVDRPLADHTRIKALDLTIESDTPGGEIWEESQRRGDDWVLSLHANPLSMTADAPDSAATLGYPIDDPRIIERARLAVTGLDSDREKVSALLNHVHGYLRYQPGNRPRGVLALLEDPVGDCTEYADLFTTLARSLGIPARTVFGLAYSESGAPAFAFHAWNEVSIDGRWQAVDPTWNQLRVDATHIPLPLNEAAAMKLLTGSVNVAFTLRDLEYFAD